MASLRGAIACSAPWPVRSIRWQQYRCFTKPAETANYYKVLGVEPTATPKEIKAAFFELSKTYHPDTNKGDSKMTEKFVQIKDAYTVLKNDAKRKEYDLKVNHPFATRQSYSSHAPPGTRPPARTSAGSARPIPNQPRRPLRPLRTPATGPDRTGGGHFTGFEADEKANRARRVAEQMSKNQEPYREPHYIPQGAEDTAWVKVKNMNRERRSALRRELGLSRTLCLALLACLGYFIYKKVRPGLSVQHSMLEPAVVNKPGEQELVQAKSKSQIPEYHPQISPVRVQSAEFHSLQPGDKRRLNLEHIERERQRGELRREMAIKVDKEKRREQERS